MIKATLLLLVAVGISWGQISPKPTTATVPGAPNHSVQTNQGGVFTGTENIKVFPAGVGGSSAEATNASLFFMPTATTGTMSYFHQCGHSLRDWGITSYPVLQAGVIIGGNTKVYDALCYVSADETGNTNDGQLYADSLLTNDIYTNGNFGIYSALNSSYGFDFASTDGSNPREDSAGRFMWDTGASQVVMDFIPANGTAFLNPTIRIGSISGLGAGPIDGQLQVGSLALLPHTPASSSETCTAGRVSDDATFRYGCTSTNAWKSIPWLTFGQTFAAIATSGSASDLGAGTVATARLPDPFTATNCSSSASPAVCASAAAGSVAIPTGTNPTLVVNTTKVTANSQIMLQSDDSLGSKLGIACNSTLASLVAGIAITARTAATSFTITFNGVLATNALCVSYAIIN